jgi:hypothetical protein
MTQSAHALGSRIWGGLRCAIWPVRTASLSDEKRRAALGADLAAAYACRERAQSLWTQGQYTEALQLATRALQQCAAAASALQVQPEPRDRLNEVLALAREASSPQQLDPEPYPPQRLFRRVIDAQDVFACALDGRARSPARARMDHLLRLLTILVLCAVVAGPALRHLDRARTQVTASASWSQKFGPRNTLDGNPASEWLLPEATQGWIEWSFHRPRAMHRIRLLNGANRPGPDRAIRRYRVDVYQNDRQIKRVDGMLGPFSPNPRWVDVELGLNDVTVSRVRLEVMGWEGNGAALAEVDFQ